MPERSDYIADHIRAYLDLAPAPAVAEIRLYQARPTSRLTVLIGEEGLSPYWAYGWAGGTGLARYILDHPHIVAGKRIADLGAGSGIVAIAAALSGASHVVAVDIDPMASVAARLNAQANGVAIDTETADWLDGPPPPVDVLTVGDVFYDATLADRVMPFLEQCYGAGMDVWVGDPGRAPLPVAYLRALSGYCVPDFGIGGTVMSTIYRLDPG